MTVTFTFFSIYTCFSIILLLQTTTTAADRLGDVCRQTKEPARCTALLTVSSSRSRVAALPELGQIAIVADTDVAGAFKIKVHDLFLSAGDPKFKKCENLYLDALDQLFIAPEYLQQRAYSKLIAAAGVVRSSVSGCAAAVANNVGLKKENEDTGVLADAIVVIAKILSA